MRTPSRLLNVTLAMAVFIMSAVSSRAQDPELLRHFDYDQKAPLNIKQAVVFLQYATQESFLTPERARQHAAVVSEPKRVKFYDAPHSLNAEARRDRIAFLTEQLKLKPLPAALIALIPNLYQPATQ